MKAVRSILAVVLGMAVGSAINMGLVKLGMNLFPIEGLDSSAPEVIAKSMPNFGIENFLSVFLAHALGTLSGAILASLIVKTKKKIFALIIGGLFLIGGITMVFKIPSPAWFYFIGFAFGIHPDGLARCKNQQ